MFEATLQSGILFLEGDVTRNDVWELERILPPLLKSACTGTLAIDCDALDIEDGMAMGALVRLLKIAVREGGSYCLHSAGQMLAHNVYRAHLMDNGVALIDTRMNEPSA